MKTLEEIRRAATLRMRRWRASNPERARAQAREGKARARSTPEGRAHERASHKRWRRRHGAAIRAKNAAREIAQLRRTPAWADLKKIEKIYEEARFMTLLMGEPYHVDHVIPLRGRRVSGLHVHNNLQIMPGVENLRKKNRYVV